MEEELETFDFSKKYEHDVISLPMAVVKEIGKIIKENKIHDNGDQLIFAIEKFIISAIGEKIRTHPKKKLLLERAIYRLNFSLEKSMVFE